MKQLIVSLFVIIGLAIFVIGHADSAVLSDGEGDKQDNVNDLKVCVKNGCLRGKKMPGYQTESFDAFLGIPYAKPPVGELRFAKPEPAADWTGILDATAPKPECIQKNYLVPYPNVTGSEDCLYLNVYRPANASPEKPLPVMVFIHGGGFFAGSISPDQLGPQYFMDNGEVILVLMAYRLGVMGFLSTGDDVSPGNYALKDQLLALKWVNENIDKFGGDQNSITIFGVSAGGVSVHMHMLNPLSEGLFHKAIVMSGSAIAPFNAPVKNPLQQVQKQAGLVGIDTLKTTDPKDLVQQLRQVDATKLIDSADGLKVWSVDPLTYYRPVIEQAGKDSFFVEDQRTLLKTGKYHAVPWLTGVVENEGAVRSLAIISNETLLNDLNANFDTILPKLMELDGLSPEIQAAIMGELGKQYLKGEKVLKKDNFEGFLNLYSDVAFLHPFYKTVESYIQSSVDLEKNPIYLYRFAFKGPFSFSYIYTGTQENYGTVHLDDTLYLFRPAFFPEFDKNSVYAKMIKTLVDFYVNFAKFGKVPEFATAKVQPCNAKHTGAICDYYEFINSPNDPNQLEVKSNNKYDLEMVKFWDELFTSRLQ